jgi:hypothetical protein
MEMQQMIERLLAGQEQMMAKRRADQAKADADREHMQEVMANIKTDQEEMKHLKLVSEAGKLLT